MSSIPSELVESNGTAALLEKLTQMITLQQTQILAMQQSHQTQPQPPHIEGRVHPNPIDVKFDGTNYGLWSQSVELYIKGQEQMRHLKGIPPPPLTTDPLYQKWETDDTIVKSWLINSLETQLRGSFIRYPTAKDVWNAITTTFYDGNDAAQVFALNRKVSRVKQVGKTVEEYYNELQGLWQEIDFRRPNPMIYPDEIEKFNKFVQENRVYMFLDGLDDKLD
jgi:gag-polypeptide of LTR copia-type